jgi:hypothetical protein
MDSLEEVDEWRRLKDLYARMNEGELEVVAKEAYALKEIARPLLKDEIARRGLKIPLKEERPARGVVVKAPVAHPVTGLDLEEMGLFETLEEARKVKRFLNDSGVPCFWGPDNVDDPAELALSIDDGLHMKVRTDDVARVRSGLNILFNGYRDVPDPETVISCAQNVILRRLCFRRSMRGRRSSTGAAMPAGMFGTTTA